MGYDDVIPHLGGFGRYQRRIYILVCLPAILCAFHKLAGVFLQAKPNHRCVLPFEDGTNATYEYDRWNMSYPFDDLTNKTSTCKYFISNFTEEYFAENIPATESIECNKWYYDKSKFDTSIVTEWNMVCSKSWVTTASDSLFMVGVLLGSIIFGYLSDRFGRKPIFFISLVIQVVFGICAGIAPEFYTYTISRMIVGATTSGVFLVAYVIAMEMVGPSHRIYAGVICMMFFSFGYMLTALFAFFITDWRRLQIALTLPGLLFMCYWWFIPESARWLISKNRKSEAAEIIKKAANENKVTIPSEILDELLDEDKKNPNNNVAAQTSILDLFRYPNLRNKSLIIFFDWFVNTGTYYGLSWNTNNLGGNPLLNFVISGAVEIPAYVFLLLTLNRWGRKTILCGCMLFGGTMLILTMFVPENHNWIIIVLAMIGKLAITASYGTVYLFSTEQFPTVIRNVGLGASSMCGRIGGIIAPNLNLLAEIWKPFPLLIFGGMAFTAGFLSLLLPETLNKTLPETIEDGERFGKKLPKEQDVNPEELKSLNEEHKNGKISA